MSGQPFTSILANYGRIDYLDAFRAPPVRVVTAPPGYLLHLKRPDGYSISGRRLEVQPGDKVSMQVEPMFAPHFD